MKQIKKAQYLNVYNSIEMDVIQWILSFVEVLDSLLDTLFRCVNESKHENRIFWFHGYKRIRKIISNKP